MWQWTSITVCPSVVEAQPNVEWRRGSHDANVSHPGLDGDFDARVRLAKGEVSVMPRARKCPSGVVERNTCLVFESGRSIAPEALDSPGVRHSEHPLAR